MMLFDPGVAAQPLLDVVERTRAELRVQAESLPPRLRPSLRQASERGVTLRYLLGPKAAYTLDARGQALVPSRPYQQGPQAADIEFASGTGSLYINPRFAELGAGGAFAPGVRSHAFYLTDRSMAVLCTGVPTPPQRPLCAAGGTELAAPLAALFDSEFLDTRPAAERASLEAQARRSLVVGPDDNSPLLELLAVPGAIVLTSALDQGLAFAHLMRGADKTLVVAPELLRVPAVAAARQRGVKVVTRVGDFEGTIVWTPGRAFLGSQRLTDAALQRDRDVGLLLQGEGADALRRFIEAKP